MDLYDEFNPILEKEKTIDKKKYENNKNNENLILHIEPCYLYDIK